MYSRTTWLHSPDRSLIVEAAAGRNIIWDFDGTIADTEQLHEQSFRDVLAEHGTVAPDGFFEEAFGVAEESIWALLRDDHGAPIRSVTETVERRQVLYLRAAESHIRAGWLADDLVSEFARVGATQHVLSNGQARTNEKLIQLFGYHHALRVVNRGTLDKAVFFDELDPAVVIDDRQHYLDLGRGLGAVTLGVLNSRSSQPLEADAVVSIAA